MLKPSLIALVALAVTGCATAPTITQADRDAVPNLHPMTTRLADECINYRLNCQMARNVMRNDAAATPNIRAALDAAVRNRQISNFAVGFMQDFLLGPQRSIRSCYQTTCIRTTYREQGGRISDVQSW